jgi:uroporphyrinogen-III synthase
MKTLPETLTARQKPFREITVYKTGPRPGFEDEFAQWLSDKSTELWRDEGVTTDRVSDSSSAATTLRKDKSRGTLWLVGFSPRGVDIAVPTLKRFLENGRCVDSSLHAATATTTSTTEAVECEGHQIKWAAIGRTTAKRIDEHLATTLNSLRTDPVPGDSASQLSCGKLNLTLSPVVAVAKTPKPEAVAEAILSYFVT